MRRKPDHVYIASDGTEFKVGCTSNVVARMREINAKDCTAALVNSWYVGTRARDVERLAHHALGLIDDGPACRQEWFRVTVEQATEAVENAIKDAPNVKIPRRKFRPPWTEKCAEKLRVLIKEFNDAN